MLFAIIHSRNRRSGRTNPPSLNLHKDNNIILCGNNVKLLATHVCPIAFQDAITILLQILRSHILALMPQVIVRSHIFSAFDGKDSAIIPNSQTNPCLFYSPIRRKAIIKANSKTSPFRKTSCLKTSHVMFVIITRYLCNYHALCLPSLHVMF